MQDSCTTVAQIAQNNIWLNVISMLVPVAASIALWIKAKAEFEHSRIRQYQTIEKVEEVKSEQTEVKKALNGNGGSH